MSFICLDTFRRNPSTLPAYFQHAEISFFALVYLLLHPSIAIKSRFIVRSIKSTSAVNQLYRSTSMRLTRLCPKKRLSNSMTRSSELQVLNSLDFIFSPASDCTNNMEPCGIRPILFTPPLSVIHSLISGLLKCVPAAPAPSSINNTTHSQAEADHKHNKAQAARPSLHRTPSTPCYQSQLSLPPQEPIHILKVVVRSEAPPMCSPRIWRHFMLFIRVFSRVQLPFSFSQQSKQATSFNKNLSTLRTLLQVFLHHSTALKFDEIPKRIVGVRHQGTKGVDSKDFKFAFQKGHWRRSLFLPHVSLFALSQQVILPRVFVFFASLFTRLRDFLGIICLGLMLTRSFLDRQNVGQADSRRSDG